MGTPRASCSPEHVGRRAHREGGAYPYFWMGVLLAVDGSAPSSQAVQVVGSMALPEGSTVRVLSVAQQPAMAGEFGALDYHRLAEDLEHQAEAIAKDACAALGALERVEPSVRSGDPRIEILLEAQSWKAELIVMGS